VDHHRQRLQPGVGLDLARQGEAIHLRHFQIGQHQRDLVADRGALAGGQVGDLAEHVPGFLTGLGHHDLHAHCLETVFDQAARQRGIVRAENLAAGADRQRRADGRRIHVGLARGQHVAQDLLDVQHLHQARILATRIELGDAGHQPALHAGLGGDHLVPVQDDFLDRFHREALRGPRVLGHEHDVQARLRIAFQQARQVDDRNHLTPDIGHAQDRRLRADHAGHRRHHQDFTDLEHIDAEQFGLPGVCRITQSEQQQLELVVVGQVGALVDVSHRAGHALAPLDGVNTCNAEELTAGRHQPLASGTTRGAAPALE
jgi:hypothetical protein